MVDTEEIVPRIFFDSSVLIAATFSQTGASYLLIQLVALGLIDGRISEDVREECWRNVRRKLPATLPALQVVLSALTEGSRLDDTSLQAAAPFADFKDVPILASAITQRCRYLVTLNERDFWPPPDLIAVVRPGQLALLIRDLLGHI